MIGSVVNMLAVMAGALLGLLLKRGLPDGVRTLVMQANGLCVLFIGMRMALASPNDVVIVISLTVGSAVGYGLRLDKHMDNLGYNIKKLARVNDSNFVEGFVSASLIYLIGAMAILGSLEAGINHNYDILFIKSALDGIMSVVLASTLGIGVLFSGFPVLIYQGGLTLLAGVLAPYLNDGVVDYMSAAGGVLLLAIGLSVAGIKNIPTINMLPGIFIAGIVGYFM